MVTKHKQEALLTFLRYLSWNELTRQCYEAELCRGDGAEIDGNEEWPTFGWHCYFYASLYVVVEAWEDHGFEDQVVDQLLAHPRGYRGLLRRFRNAVFHHQRDFTDPRFLGLLREGEQAVLWVTALQDEFKRFVQNRLNKLSGTVDQRIEMKRRLRGLLGWLPGEPEEIRALEQTVARAGRLLSSHPADRVSEASGRDLALAVSEGSQVLATGRKALEDLRRERLRGLGIGARDGG